MLLVLLRLALAADPAPAEVPAKPPPPACDGAQRCGDGCIPWTDVCPAALTDAVAASIRADHDRALVTALCASAPTPYTAPKTPEETAAWSIVAATVAGAAPRQSLADQRATQAEAAVDALARPDYAASPPCGAPPDPAPPPR